MAGKKKQKSAEVGLYAKNYSKPIRWKLDMDYLNQLPRYAKEWLGNNLQALYGARKDHALAEGWTVDEYRAASRDVDAARRDSYSLKEAIGLRSDFDESSYARGGCRAAVREYMAAKAKDAVEADYPVSEGILWTRIKAGWVATTVRVQGRKVIEEDVLTRGAPVTFAELATTVVNELPRRLQDALNSSKRS